MDFDYYGLNKVSKCQSVKVSNSFHNHEMFVSRKDLCKEIRILYKYVVYEGLNSGLLLKDENENANK